MTATAVGVFLATALGLIAARCFTTVLEQQPVDHWVRVGRYRYARGPAAITLSTRLRVAWQLWCIRTGLPRTPSRKHRINRRARP